MPPTTTSAKAVTDETLRALSNELVRLGRRREMTSAARTLDASAFKILWILVEDGPHTLRGLADYLGLDQSTINRQVHAVIGHGFVERYDEPDSAAKLIRATAAGEAAYRSDSEIRRDGLRAIVNTLGEQSTADLAQGLASFNDAIDSAVEGSLRGE